MPDRVLQTGLFVLELSVASPKFRDSARERLRTRAKRGPGNQGPHTDPGYYRRQKPNIEPKPNGGFLTSTPKNHRPCVTSVCSWGVRANSLQPWKRKRRRNFWYGCDSQKLRLRLRFHVAGCLLKLTRSP